MNKYTTRLYKSEFKEVEIEAANPAEALQKARLENPSWHCDFVHDVEAEEDFNVVGACEHCNSPLFEQDEHEVFADENEDTFELCLKCLGALGNIKK